MIVLTLDHDDRHHSITLQSKMFVSDGDVTSTNHVVARSRDLQSFLDVRFLGLLSLVMKDCLGTGDLALVLWGQHVDLNSC